MVESAETKIADIFTAPGRFLRSVQLERDFSDPLALESYIATPPMAEALHRMLESIQDGSQRRAWCQRQSKSEPNGSAKCCHFGVGEIAA